MVGDVEGRLLVEAPVRLQLRERLAGEALVSGDVLAAGGGKKRFTSIRLDAITCDSQSMKARIERGWKGIEARRRIDRVGGRILDAGQHRLGGGARLLATGEEGDHVLALLVG